MFIPDKINAIGMHLHLESRVHRLTKGGGMQCITKRGHYALHPKSG